MDTTSSIDTLDVWNLNLEKIASLVSGGLGSIAIESGTCRGNGTRSLAKYFERVITIELSEELFKVSQSRFEREGISNIESVLGNSAAELERLLPGLSKERIFFFLDAHWSGDDSVDWSSSEWKGYGLNTAHAGAVGALPSSIQQCPLAEEISAIIKFARGPVSILIDDMKNIPADGPGLKNKTFMGENWSHLSRALLLKLVKPRLLSLHELKDPEQWLLTLSALPPSV